MGASATSEKSLKHLRNRAARISAWSGMPIKVGPSARARNGGLIPTGYAVTIGRQCTTGLSRAEAEKFIDGAAVGYRAACDATKKEADRV